MAAACREPTQNPGLTLGTLMGALAAIGRDKLTLFLSPELAPLGASESSSSSLAQPASKDAVSCRWRASRLSRRRHSFGSLLCRAAVARWSACSAAEQLEAIITAGHPVYEIDLGDKYDLGAEFFRWEFATAVAASLLEVNPFDEPEAVDSRQALTRLLDCYRQTGKLPVAAGVVDAADAAIVKHLAAAKPGDYLAIGAYFQPTPERDVLLGTIRTLCG